MFSYCFIYVSTGQTNLCPSNAGRELWRAGRPSYGEQLCPPGNGTHGGMCCCKHKAFFKKETQNEPGMHVCVCIYIYDVYL